jgi:hypothetical protein
MNDLTLPASLAAELADLKRRLANLERSSALSVSAIQDGRLRILDGDNVEVGRLGKLEDGTYGVAFLDADGAERVRLGQRGGGEFGIAALNDEGTITFDVGNEGLTRPAIMLPISAVGSTSIVVTNATFTDTYQTFFGAVTHDALRLEVLVQTAVGTTAEVRLTESAGLAQTSAVAIPSGNNSVRTQFNWAPGWTVGDLLNIQVKVQARRTSGAGNVNVYIPDYAFLAGASLIGATATGV